MDLAHKRKVEHISTGMERSIPFHTLVKLANAKNVMKWKLCILDLPPETNIVTKKLEFQKVYSEACDSKPQSMFKLTINPINKNET